MPMYMTDKLKEPLETYLLLHQQVAEKKASPREVLKYKAAFEEIYVAFSALTEGLLNSNRLFLFSPDRESLAQDTIVHLLSKIPNFSPERGVFSYFNVVARNFLILTKEKNKRRQRIFPLAESGTMNDSTLVTESPDAVCASLGIGDSPEKKLNASETQVSVVTAMERIAARTAGSDLGVVAAAAVVLMKDVHNHEIETASELSRTIASMAEASGIPRKKVAGVLRTFRAELRSEIDA